MEMIECTRKTALAATPQNDQNRETSFKRRGFCSIGQGNSGTQGNNQSWSRVF